MSVPANNECPIFTYFISEREGKKSNFDLWQWHERCFSRYCEHPGGWGGGGGKLQRVRGLFAVTAAEQCRSMPLFTTSARPGACQPVLHLPVSPYAQLSWRRNRDGSSSWCRSKSQKTDTEPSYVNIVRKTVTLFPMVIELHTVMLFREHLANVLLHFEKQLCKYSWNRLMGSVFCILENWSYR